MGREFDIAFLRAAVVEGRIQLPSGDLSTRTRRKKL